MASHPKPPAFWKYLTILAVPIVLLTSSCMLGELLVMEINKDRTATARAIDTIWRTTYTAEARTYNDKTATAWQVTQKADMLTHEAQIKSLTETAMAPKPPVITGISFPSEIPGNRSTMIGLLYFTDPDGDIQYVTYDVVSATNFAGGVDNDPKLDSGTWTNGAIKIYLWCEGQQTVTLRATLYDFAGNRSNSMDFTFTCK